jgi:hypothetical protein
MSNSSDLIDCDRHTYNLMAGVFTNPSSVLEYEFVQSRKESCIKHVDTYSFVSSIQQVVANMINCMHNSGVTDIEPVRCIDTDGRNAKFYIKSKSVLLTATPPGHTTTIDFFDQKHGIWRFDIVGSPDFVYAIKTHIETSYINKQSPTVRWHYMGSHGEDYRDISLSPEDRKDPRDSFYPWLESGVENYLNQYTNSSAPILLMAGAPGTGKTSLLRHFMFRYQKMGYRAHITYDERILNGDQLFIDVITGNRPSILIVEDADVLLTSRESDANKMISRFLNVSDGLIPLHNKKIVFTTNLTDFQRIDSALTRPGRCFDFMHCRKLSASETSIATADIGVTDPGCESTLAEIFNQKKNIDLPRIGFI